MDVVLIEHIPPSRFYPLTLTRPVADLRMGVLTFAERWSKLLKQEVLFKPESRLEGLFPQSSSSTTLNITSNLIPCFSLVRAVESLKAGEVLHDANGNILAYVGSQNETDWSGYHSVKFLDKTTPIEYPWHLFSFNHTALDFDFELITEGRTRQSIPKSNGVIAEDRIFLEEGAKVEFATLNATDGPIYLASDTEICEGSNIRGGLALCEGAKINMGSKIYGATTIGPVCKVGGEVNNSVLHSYSNKGHEGFLGNSVIGQWCNLGADTNTSNMKNNYSSVKVWSYEQRNFIDTGLQFCGLIMGDHSKSAIDTRFNTGTVVGFSSNVFAAGFPPKLIQDFDWGGENSGTVYELNKALQTAQRMMNRRNMDLTPAVKSMFEHIYDCKNDL